MNEKMTYNNDQRLSKENALERAETLKQRITYDGFMDYENADQFEDEIEKDFLHELESGNFYNASCTLLYFEYLLPEDIKIKIQEKYEAIRKSFVEELCNGEADRAFSIRREFEKYIPFDNIPGLENQVKKVVQNCAKNRFGISYLRDYFEKINGLVDLKPIVKENEEAIRETMKQEGTNMPFESYVDIFGKYIDFTDDIKNREEIIKETFAKYRNGLGGSKYSEYKIKKYKKVFGDVLSLE